MLAAITDQINILKSSLTHKNSSKPPDPTTVVPYNRSATLLDSVQSKTIDIMWTLKYEISSPRFYEFLNKKRLKGDNALDHKNFYSHIKIRLNAVTRL